MLRTMNRLSQSQIIIMAYRNYAEGENGAIELAGSEINEASLLPNNNITLIIAQETGKAEPEFVTYFREPRATLDNEISKIRSHFKNMSAFGGISIDHADSFFKLK